MSIDLPPEIIKSDKTPRTAIAIDKTSGVKQRSDTAREVLLVGMMAGSGGTASVATPYEILRETQGEGLFGAGSMLDFAIKAAFKAHPFVKLSAVAVAEAGVKGSATVTFVTTATGNTIYRLRIAGVEVAIDITLNDAVATMATNLANAITANTSLPVTASPAAGVVTITAKNGGTTGNGIQLRGAFDANVTTTATISSSSLASGTGSASLTAALAAATGKRYHEVAILIDDSTAGGAGKTSVESESDGEHMHGEFAHQCCNGTLSTATTLGGAINGARNQVFAINTSESWSVAIAAAGAAVMSRQEDATKPLNRTVLVGILPPPVEKRWTRTETRSLLDSGVTPLIVLPGEQVAIARAVTTGVTNAASAKDYSTLDITIFRGLDDVRDNVGLMFDTNYGASKWADNDPDGQLPSDVATPEKVTRDILDVLRDRQAAGICQQVEALADQIVVQKVGTHCEFSIPANIIDGMHERLGKVVLIRRNVTSV